MADPKGIAMDWGLMLTFLVATMASATGDVRTRRVVQIALETDLTPPGWVFLITWTASFTCMAAAARVAPLRPTAGRRWHSGQCRSRSTPVDPDFLLACTARRWLQGWVVAVGGGDHGGILRS
jgi:hypothetical protein